MFSLIIVLVSIALVAALVLATIYYGGASKEATLRASASTLVNQATQIHAAGMMATTQGGAWPAYASGPAFSQPFISAMPVPPKSAYADGVATPAATDWSYYLTDGSSHHFSLKNKISAGVCMAVNKSQGVIGIPAAWDGTSVIQCFGPGVGSPGALAYTFFFQAGDATPAQNAAALTQSVSEGGTGANPGYPRLCPDATTITTGVCPADTALAATPPSTPSTPATPTPPAETPADVGFGVTVTPGEWALGSVPIGDTATKTFTLNNGGTEGIWVYTWVNNNQNFKHPSGCGSKLVPGGSCTLTMNFNAGNTAQAVSDILNIELDADSGPYVIKEYPLTATVSASSVSATVSPSSLNFGTIAIGDVGAQAVTVTNTGTSPLTVARAINSINPAALGGSPVDSSKGEMHNCVNVAPGASCTITAHFAPFAAGAANGTLDVYFQGQSSPQSISVASVGQDSGAWVKMGYLGADIGSLSYSDYPGPDYYWTGPNPQDSRTWIPVDSASKTMTFQFSNPGPRPLTYVPSSGNEGFLQGTAPDAAGWMMQSTTCGNTLAVGASCSITVKQDYFQEGYGTGFSFTYTNVPGTLVGISRIFTLCGAGKSYINGTCTTGSTGSTVVFFGNWSSTIGQSELLLTNNVPSSCLSAVGVSGQNECMRTYFQSQLGAGASCALSYSDAASEVVARHPTALKEEYLQCSGVTGSNVAGIASYFPEGYRMN